MLIEVLGKTPGYFRGKGAGVRAPSSKGLIRTAKINQIREELQVEMQYENQQYIEKRLPEQREKMQLEFQKKWIK